MTHWPLLFTLFYANVSNCHWEIWCFLRHLIKKSNSPSPLPPHPTKHVQTCSLCSSYCQKGGWLAFYTNTSLYFHSLLFWVLKLGYTFILYLIIFILFCFLCRRRIQRVRLRAHLSWLWRRLAVTRRACPRRRQCHAVRQLGRHPHHCTAQPFHHSLHEYVFIVPRIK